MIFKFAGLFCRATAIEPYDHNFQVYIYIHIHEYHPIYICISYTLSSFSSFIIFKFVGLLQIVEELPYPNVQLCRAAVGESRIGGELPSNTIFKYDNMRTLYSIA